MSKEKSNLQKSISNVKFGILNQFITIALGIILPRLVLVSLGSEANGLLNSINQAIVYLALLEGGIGLTITKALYGPVAQIIKKKLMELCRRPIAFIEMLVSFI